MTEYDLFIPLRYNDGSPVEAEKLDHLRHQLTEFFGGLTDMRHRSAGRWKVGGVTFHDEIVIYRVLADRRRPARRFLRKLKGELKAELGQQEVLIVERRVEVL
jgi:hypothetical protein